jgi:hypothetical protein
MTDIAQDEELTMEYNLCNFGGEIWECRCGSPDCRGVHRCGFRYMDRSRQIRFLPYLDPIIVKVHQDYIAGVLTEAV